MRNRRVRSDAQRWERSARFWLRAYPRRWRAQRADEVLAVLMDLAAPGARRVGVRTAVDLVKGGWATRWRGHPPLLPWLGYRHFGRRMPTEYRPWIEDDLQSPFAPFVAGLFFLALAGALEPWLDMYRDPGFIAFMASAMTLAQLVSARRRRLELGVKHLVPQPGEAVHVGQLVLQSVRRRRVSARAVLPWLIGALGGVLVAAGVAEAVGSPSARVVAFVGAAAVVGAVVTAALARRRLGRIAALAVEQPGRGVAGPDGLGWTRLATSTVAGVGWIALEAAGLLPLPVSAVVLATGPAALVLAMTALAATRCQAAPAEVALADLWWVLRHDGPIPVDAPVAGLAPMPGPVREGLVVPPRLLGGPRFPALPV